MQFVANGPDIPDVLLQAYEENRVVFFCGAGISYPAGPPDFKGLVDKIYEEVGTVPTESESTAYGSNQFDAPLDLLERRLQGQGIGVRKALEKILQPNLGRKGATDTHEALLQLARNREGALRLVTTNFDRVFERVAKRTKQSLHESGLAARFPEEALLMLNAVITDQRWRARELSLCLASIYKASPTLGTDHRYQKLSEYARKN